MENWMFFGFELLFAGSAIAFAVWQLVSVRCEMRRDAERAASDKTGDN